MKSFPENFFEASLIESCLGQVFNSRLGRFVILIVKCMSHIVTSRVKNLAKEWSFELEFAVSLPGEVFMVR